MATVTQEKKEQLQAKYEKEHGDVIRTLNSIEHTMEGILDKKEKAKTASTKALRKEYNAQIKSSEKYLDTLFKTLKLEMLEQSIVSYDLDRAVVGEVKEDGQANND